MMADPVEEIDEVRLELPSRLEMLSIIDKVVDGIADQMSFEDDDKDAIAISVIEAGTNAIQHGHKRDASKIVGFRFDLAEEYLLVTVHDTGPGFDLDAVLARNPTMPDALMNCSGRGIFIMREMMDRVDFDISSTAGTTVRLLKRKRSNGGSQPGDPIA